MLKVMKFKFQIVKANTLGMFDLLKGVAMLLIVLVHHRSLFPADTFDNVIFQLDKAAFSSSAWMTVIYYLLGLLIVLFSCIAVAMMPTVPL